MDNVTQDWAYNWWVAREHGAVVTVPEDSDRVLILLKEIPDAEPTQ